MAWTAPRNWAVGEVLTSANMDTYISDNLTFLMEATASFEVFYATTALATGDGKYYFPIPSKVNGFSLTSCLAEVFAPSSSGTPTIQIARGRQANATSAHTFVDMLTTRITIDANEYSSVNAAVPYVINAANDDVATGDLIRVDEDVTGTGTTGLYICLGFKI